MENFDTWTADQLTEQNAAFVQAMQQAGYGKPIDQPKVRRAGLPWDLKLSTRFEEKFPWAWPLGPNPYQRTFGMAAVAKQVAKKHGVSVGYLRGSGRAAKLNRARQEAFWRCHSEGLSYPQIGRYFGGRHHTTIIHGCNRHEERLLNGTAL